MFLMIGLYGDNIFYCRYILRNVNLFGPLMTMFQLALIGGMVFVSPLLKKFGKRNAALAGTGIAIVGQSVMFLAPTNFTVIATGAVIKGLGISPLVGTLLAMNADTIEYGEWKTGIRVEGLTFGVGALLHKIAVGLGAVMLGWMLGASGYVGGVPVQPAPALFAVKLMFLHLPLALLIVIGLVLWMYRLDAEYPSIVAELKLRQPGAQ
jgi:glycoside/pentoside/hexuronide:cation symporter, GPH family